MAEAQEPAGFGPRLFATLFDWLWLIPALSVLLFVGMMANGTRDEGNELTGHLSNHGFLALHVIWGLVVLLFWVEREATPGKMVLRLRIVDAATGGVPSFRQLVLRYIGYYASGLLLGLGYLLVLWDPRRQALHDKIAGTLVVRASR